MSQGETSVHYAAKVVSNDTHYKEEDAKLISILIDYGGEPERQTFSVGERGDRHGDGKWDKR